MSILQEVMKSVEEIEWNNLNERLPVLVIEANLCKTEVFKILDEFYVEFTEKPVEIPDVLDKLSGYQTELTSLISSCKRALVKEIPSSPKYIAYQAFLDQANNADQILMEVKSCYSIHEKFVALRSCKNDCERSLKIIEEIRDIMQDSETVKKYYRDFFISVESSLHTNFEDVLSQKFEFGVKNNLSYLIVNNVNIENIVQTLLKYSQNIEKLEDLTHFIWEYVIVPIVTSAVKMISEESELKLKIMSNKVPYYKDVFERLLIVSKFFADHFSFSIDNSKDKTLLNYIGNRLENKISPLIISHCFPNILKCGSEGAIDYKSILQEVIILQKALNHIKLVTDDSLVNYAENLQEMELKKKCNLIFHEIKTLLSVENYDIVSTGTLLSSNGNDPLPLMLISTVVQELHQLTEKILLEAKNDFSRIFVLCDVFNYFRNYTTRDIYDKTPKEVALLHNNFIFFAHELNDWNTFFGNIISIDKNVPIFKSEAFLFQTVGENILKSFSMKQKNNLQNLSNQLLQNKDLTSKSFENIFQKLLDSINPLIDIWFSMLPQVAFCKYIGASLNVICSFLIEIILRGESNDKNLIEEISIAFGNILNLGAKFFKGEDDLKRSIECWERFKTLSLIVDSDIVKVDLNKYHELLKLHFEAADVTKIIKSLFEPSRRRDCILLQCV